MEKLLKIALFIFVLAAAIFITSPPQKAYAQLGSIGIANYLPISDSKIEDGDIIVASNKGYYKSRIPYETGMVGVASLNPAVAIKSSGEKGTPVISTGTVYTKVTDEGGAIKKGEFITTSSIPGTGMKAEDSGYVLGKAASDMTFSKKGEIRLLLVSLSPQFMQTETKTSNSIFNIFKLSEIAAYEKPTRILQYIVATIITIVTFGCGFFIFAKAVNTGLEALGRNPLAGRMIQFSLIFNLIMIIVIIVVGTGLAYLVLRL